MSNPSKPVRTTTLVTPAMQTPHESVVLNEKRGLLAAVSANPTTEPGVVDVYDLNDDCRRPALQSSAPVGFLGHESGFAPDGRTFYATSLFDGHVTAVDLTNAKLPVPLTVFNSLSHGLTVSEDGNRGYVAARGVGLSILDLRDIQSRKPVPQVREISHLGWDTLTIPQVAIPVTIGGRRLQRLLAAGRKKVATSLVHQKALAIGMAGTTSATGQYPNNPFFTDYETGTT